MIKIFFLVIFVGIVSVAGWMSLQSRNQAKLEEKVLRIDNVGDIENILGDPMYVFSSPNSWFAGEIITPQEYEDGLSVRAYLVKKTPPRFLIVKVGRDGKKILKSQIETS